MSDTEQPLSFTVSTDAWVARQELPAETSQVTYHSAGHTLLVCSAFNEAEPHLAKFGESGLTVCVIDASSKGIEKQLLEQGVAVFTVPALALTGHLGAFSAVAVAVDGAKELNLAVSVFRESGAFDTVLDCLSTPLIDVSLKPFGYTHCTQSEAMDGAIEELVALVGEFDKPKYFDYDLSVCAHSRSELNGCNRCMDVCATGAIYHDGEGVKVDPYLCQGCGTCATVCPSGAMSYAYPRPSNAIERSREMLASTSADTLMLYSEKHQSTIDALALPETIHALLVEEVTAYGLDYWLSLLAGHVRRIVVLVSGTVLELDALTHQQSLLNSLLEGLDIDEPALHFLSVDEATQWESLPSPVSALKAMPKTQHSTHNNKRQTIRLALDSMADSLGNTVATSERVTPLPENALFGRLAVNTDACTLCMACVSTCPAQALQDGQDTPALKFIESNCVQCGLCTQACPESALTLQPQYQWDSVAARQVETLHEDEPFHCISCHTPFATSGVIAAMATRLGGHWMFQDDKAMRRLKMCGDCRVKDIFREDAKGIQTHKDEA